MEMSVDQFEEAKLRSEPKNENTAVNEQAKVGGKLKLRLQCTGSRDRSSRELRKAL